MCLDSFLVWVQIHGLPVPLKTEAFGWALGDQLGEVKAVAHQNHQIVSEHLRVRIIHKVDEQLRMSVAFTPVGSKEEFSFNVKYEKLPNFCLSCGIVGHMTAKQYSGRATQGDLLLRPQGAGLEWVGSASFRLLGPGGGLGR